MAIRDLCSFDALVTADLDERFTTLAGGPAIVAGAGRGGTAALRLNSQFVTIAKSGLPVHATYGVAMSLKVSVVNPSAIIQLLDTTVTSNQEQVCVSCDATGRLSVKRQNNGGTMISSLSAPVIFPAVQHHVQFMATIHDTLGSYELRVDGATILSGSGVDTKNSANAYADGYHFNGMASSNVDIDDVYVWDGSGSANTGFPGDVRVLSALPSGAGASTGFTPSTGANHTAVDDVSPNTSDYVSGDTVGEKDTYAFADIVGSGTVRGALLSVYATKAAEGASRGIKGVCRSGATEQLTSEVALAVGWRYWLQAIYENDPATAAVWASVAALNSAEWGVSVTT